MKERSKVIRKVVRLQREEGIIPPHSSVLIALSGGVDSVVLTDTMVELRDFFKLKRLAVAHFNHMLREEAEEEERFCREFAESYGLKIFIGREKVEEVARRERKNLEETARELRYAFLRGVKEREGFDLIATAHHLSDLVETALIWLVRGAGMEGLLGFEPKEGDVVRPLYRVTREEILTYAMSKGLRWVEDPSNRDLRFFRNRIRTQVIPIMKDINPNLEETFLRMRRILKSEDDLLKEMAEGVFTKVRRGECIDANMLKEEHIALQRRVLREFTGVFNFSKIEQLRRLLLRGGKVDLGEGRKAVRKGSLICLKNRD